MDQSWIDAYGYIGVLVGGILEGEVAFILSGYAASRGYLETGPTFLLAVAGGAIGDSFYYWLGRLRGPGLMRRFRFLRLLRARAVVFLRRWGRASAFLVRFAYGLRIVLPVTIGAARLRYPTFLLFNLLGSAVFAALYLSVGFLFGETAERILGSIGARERWIVMGVLGAGAIIWLVREWRLLHPADAGGTGGGE